ncbi:hypothetical protein HK099_006755 [Clydaea vesicula]|uniref:Peptide hydrolase n=1 Tax=Clydaea vesicula TaxID=447962 RepID=A0AAD5XY33_9FUNG|nr:hypothetical protein HK099_006755 [Clydaea vesicula]
MKSTLLFISLLLILVALIVENIFREAKNIPSNTNDPFNSTRAYNHLKEIAKERHPIASEANKKVQDYIVGQLKNIKNNIANNTNVAMEIVDSDDTELLWSSNSNEYFKSSNVLCKVIGKNEALDPSSPSFLLSAHYDSVPSSYGASDDGGGIAILLEVVEKIVSQGQPSYTLIVNFNNGEEFGLLGSKSFAKHQWFENVAVFLNMEGGGTGGKEFIFRSTNAELSKLYGESATHPTGDSIGGDFIRSGLIRSVTDFSIYADTYGIPGLDIAFVERRVFIKNFIPFRF